MANTLIYNEKVFGVGDRVKVHQKITESGKVRKQVFLGMVIAIKGNSKNKTFTVRRIGEQKIGIEKIFPVDSPTITDIEVSRPGLKGAKKAKLYFTRKKSKREIDKIFSREKLRK